MPSTRSSTSTGQPADGEQPPLTSPAPGSSTATGPQSATAPSQRPLSPTIEQGQSQGPTQQQQQRGSPPPAVLGKRKVSAAGPSADATDQQRPVSAHEAASTSFQQSPQLARTSPPTPKSASAAPNSANMDTVMHNADGMDGPFGMMGLPPTSQSMHYAQQHFSPSTQHNFQNLHPHPHHMQPQQQYYPSQIQTPQPPMGQMLPPGPVKRPSVSLARGVGSQPGPHHPHPAFSQPQHPGINGHSPHLAHRGSFSQDGRPTSNGIIDSPMDGNDAASSNGRAPSNAGSGNGEGKDAGDAPRTGRACLACRKLKTRCDGAEDPPCRRCRQGGHECIFVESKRGKRPVKKHASGDLVEKFKQVEQTLNMVIQSINSGQPPDAATVQHLHRMQQTLASDAQQPNGEGAGPQGKHTSPGSVASSSNHTHSPSFQASASLAGGSQGDLPPIHRRPSAFTSTGSAQKPTDRERSQPSVTQGAALSMLAEASLAAELDGTKGITGLDPTFNLSKVTEALEMPAAGDSPTSLSSPSDKVTPGSAAGGAGQGSGPGSTLTNGVMGDSEKPAPALLTKGIVDADTAVELFRVFFDYCYIHLPLLDPAQNSATAVCARSPFLFTVICAIASRFHPNPELDPACYEEAHACFMNMIVNGERTIEAVQACMLLTVWTAAPKAAVDDRPQQAWLYHGMAVRVAMELGLFRPPSFSDLIPMRNGRPQGGFPWNALKDVPQEKQREALNRERTWLLLFIIDRYIATVTGRPYQVHDAKPFLIPTHPLSLPFDLGIIAHQELQSVVGQVMDTFRDRIYGFSAASNEMPSPVVMKLFNGRMDEWRQRWCPKSGEPISNNLLFYWYNSKLFLNTFPLQTMLRNGEAADDPECVSTCINSAKEIFDLVHKYAELGVLRHCPDFNLLVLLYAAVFLLKVRVSESRFSQLVAGEELERLIRQAIDDCSSAMISERHATGSVARMFKALLATWRKMNAGGVGPSRHGSSHGHSRPHSRRESVVDFSAFMNSNHNSPKATFRQQPPETSPQAKSSPLAQDASAQRTPNMAAATSGQPSGAQTDMIDPSGLRLGPLPNPQGMFSGLNTPAPLFHGASRPHTPGDPLESFLSDTHFYDSMLISQGSDGFFAWQDGMDSANMLDFDGFNGLMPNQPSQQQ